MVEALAGVLAAAADLPFALFGHSMGGLVAFELARILRDRGYPQPVHLFVSASAAPNWRQPRRPLSRAADGELRKELEALNGTPPALLADDDLMARMLPALRADLAVLEDYEYRDAPPLDVPITVFGGAFDRVVRFSALDGWRMETAAGSRLLMLPADHFFLHDMAADILSAVAADTAGCPLAVAGHSGGIASISV
jgi:surfactin synthase thioesterase subunit